MINKVNKTAPPHGFYLSCERVVGGVSMIVGGVIGIVDFTDCRAELLSRTGRITVIGERLSLTVFDNKSIEIFGGIEDIKFAYGKG